MKQIARLIRMACYALPFVLSVGMAQDSKATLAVVRIWHGGPVSNSHELTASYAAQLTDFLAESDAVQVLPPERILEAIDDVGFNPDDILDLDDALEVGEELGATHIVVGAALVTLQGIRVDARIYTVETEALHSTATAEGTSADEAAIMKTLSTQLLNRIAEPEGTWKATSNFRWNQEFKIVASTAVERISHPQLIATMSDPPFELTYEQEMERFVSRGNKPSAFVLYIDDESLITINPDNYAPYEYRSHTYELGGIEYTFDITLQDIKIYRESMSRRSDSVIQWMIDATILIDVKLAE